MERKKSPDRGKSGNRRAKPPAPGPKKHTGLTDKQRAFVREFLVDYNATQAARRSGYTAKAAGESGYQLLKNIRVQHALREAQRMLVKRLELSADALVAELLNVAQSDIGEIVDFSGPTLKFRPPSQIPEHARRVIASLRVRRHISTDPGGATLEETLSRVDLRNNMCASCPLVENTKERIEALNGAHEVEVVDFKLWDKIAANEKLGKHLGIFRDQVVVISSDELQRYIRAWSAAFRRFVPASDQAACEAFIRAQLDRHGDGGRLPDYSGTGS